MNFYGRPTPTVVGTPYGPQQVYPPQGFVPGGVPPVHGSTACPQCLQYHAPNLPCPAVASGSQAPSRAASRSRRESSLSSSSSTTTTTTTSTGSGSSSSTVSSRASRERERRRGRRRSQKGKSRSASLTSRSRGRAGKPKSKAGSRKMRKRRSPSPSASSSGSSSGSGSRKSRSSSSSSSDDDFHPSAAQLLAIGERIGEGIGGSSVHASQSFVGSQLAMPAPVYPGSSLLPAAANREQYYRDILQSYSRTPSHGRASGTATPVDGQLRLQLEAQRLRHLLEQRRTDSRSPHRSEFGSIGYAASQLPSLPQEARLSSAHPSGGSTPMEADLAGADGYFAAGALHRRSQSGGAGGRPGLPKFPSSYMPSPADASQIEAAMQHKSVSEAGFPPSKVRSSKHSRMAFEQIPVNTSPAPTSLASQGRMDMYQQQPRSRTSQPQYTPQMTSSTMHNTTRANARRGAGAVPHPLQTVTEPPASSFCGLCYGSGR